jgi:rhodanese-related sulfurtransferase
MNEIEYRRITASEAKQMMDEHPNAVIVDVRTEDEYNAKRIPGAVLLPDFDILEKAHEVLPDKNALILIYCRTGRRTVPAAYNLIDLGYTNVYDFGGIVDWVYEVYESME